MALIKFRESTLKIRNLPDLGESLIDQAAEFKWLFYEKTENPELLEKIKTEFIDILFQEGRRIQSQYHIENSTPDPTQALEAEITYLQKKYGHRFIFYTPPYSNILKKTYEKDINLAQRILALLVLSDIDFSDNDMTDALLAIRQLTDPESKQITQLEEWVIMKKNLLKQQKELTKLIASAAKSKSDIDINYKKWEIENKTKLENFISDKEEEITTATGNYQSRLADVLAATEQQTAFSIPISYWDQKKIQHEKGMWLAIFFAFVFFTTYIATIKIYYNTVLSSTSNNPTSAWGANVETAAFILIISLGFWALRLPIKIFFSQLHLHQDANERITLIKTYISMLKISSIKDGDIGHVLISIFRPTTDGLIKDDGIPSILAESLKK